ncbi:MAG TPA: cation diffusion facilitator family transporter [Clostridiaceae bacterium]
MDKKNGALLSIFSNSFLIVFKLLIGLSINSISILSEAVHSGLDLVASVIAFFSIRTASKKEDEDHPFGHGKYENLSGFVEALLIFLAAAIIIYEAIGRLISGGEIKSTTLGIVIMLVSSLINLIISLSLFRIAKKSGSIALEADAYHLLTDVFTSLGVFAGLIIVKITHQSIVDSIAALLVAGLIIRTSIGLTLKSMRDLVDYALPKEEMKIILDVILSHEEVKSFHKLRTRKSGSRRELDLHLLLNADMTLLYAEKLCDDIENELKAIYPDIYITIHSEPENHVDVNNLGIHF